VGTFVLEIEQAGATRQQPLSPGLTRIGGPGCEVLVAGGGADQVHLWDAPPKLVFVGKGERPRVDGLAVDEAALAGGERIEWLGAVFRLRREPVQPVLRELPLAEAAGAPADGRAASRVLAGLMAELGLADRAVTKRWQEAILQGGFEPDACSRELMRSSTVAPEDVRLLERSGRLLRDLLMAPYHIGLRGAGRRARVAARSGLAFVVAQVLVLLLFAVLFALVLLVLRVGYGLSLDALLDQVVELLPS